MTTQKDRVIEARRGQATGYVMALARDGGFTLTPRADKARRFQEAKARELAEALYRPPGFEFVVAPVPVTPSRPAAGA